MGCGCNKGNGMRGVKRSRNAAIRSQGSISAQSTPARPTPVVNNQSISAQSVSTSPSGAAGQRKEIERKRKSAILKRLGKF